MVILTFAGASVLISFWRSKAKNAISEVSRTSVSVVLICFNDAYCIISCGTWRGVKGVSLNPKNPAGNAF